MAFNPFTWFRKHQKVLFAGLILLTMVVFIGQFGAGDVFQRALAWFGSTRASGQQVITLYKKKVHEADLEKLAKQRRLANHFMNLQAYTAIEPACKDLIDNYVKDNAELRSFVMACQGRMGGGLFTVVTNPRGQMEARRQMGQHLERLDDLARMKTKDTPENLQVLQRIATIIGYQLWLIDYLTSRPPQEAVSILINMLEFEKRGIKQPPLRAFYFGLSDKVDDLLDFMVWRHEAEELNIKLTAEDIKKLVVEEAAGTDVFDAKETRFEDDPKVKAYIRVNPIDPNLTPRQLLDALREEFLVQMAQANALGDAAGVRQYRGLRVASSPALATPDEFLHYFRENRTVLKAQFLPIPVERFLSQVREKFGQPTEPELRAIYELYRDRVPRPDSREPGFVEPRRIVIEFLAVSPEHPHYGEKGEKDARFLARFSAPVEGFRKGKETAKEQEKRLKTELTEAGNRILTGIYARTSGLVAPGGNQLAAVAAGCGLLLFDPLQREYEDVVRQGLPLWGAPETGLKPQYPGVIEASMLRRQIGVAPASAGGPLTGIMQGWGALVVRERLEQENARFVATLATTGSPAEHLLGMSVLAVSGLPPVPMKSLEPQLVARLRERLAADELRADLTKFTTELAKEKAKGTTAASEYVAKAQLHWKQLATKDPKHAQWYRSRPMSRDEMREGMRGKGDPGLTTLREALRAIVGDRALEAGLEMLFGERENVFVRRLGLYDSLPATVEGRKEVRFWRAEDKPQQPREYDKVRAEVQRAWELEKARQLARRQALALQEKINKPRRSPEDAARILADAGFGQPFELDNIARLLPRMEVLAGRPTEYHEYVVPENMTDKFTYPPADLAKQLMTLKRPGEAMIVVDRPALNYYISVLESRSEPTMSEFKTVMQKTPRFDTLYDMFLNQRRQDYRNAVMKQLRQKAAPGSVDADGRFKSSMLDEIRKRDREGQSERE